ncbi:MAG: hypothetical protein ACXVCF_16635, partial [Isosphaeraceae bacterium]
GRDRMDFCYATAPRQIKPSQLESIARRVNDVREGISTSLQDIRIGKDCQDAGNHRAELWPRTFARDKLRELGSQLALPDENSQPTSGPGSGPLMRSNDGKADDSVHD